MGLDSLSNVGWTLLQEKEMEKQRLLYQQARLHTRGAAEMVLQMISACKGALRVHLAPPEYTRPVPAHPAPLDPAGTPSHPSCMWFALLPCNFPLIPSILITPAHTLAHSSNQPCTHTLAHSSAQFSDIPPGVAVFWWAENTDSKLSRPLFAPCRAPLQPVPPRRDRRHGVLHPEAGHLHPKWRQC